MNYLTPNWPAPKNIKAYTTIKNGWDISQFALPSEPIWIKQIHSAIALPATVENINKEADATFTNQPNHVCIVFTADCLPILICHQSGHQVAAIHAGWRGLAAGIIETTLMKMQQTPRSELLAWLGPAIGPQRFEVGNDVFAAFTEKYPDTVNAFLPYQENKWLADIYELARIRLRQQGVQQIYGGTYCTFTQEDLFYSYRRDRGQTGRLKSVIWFEE